MPSFTFIDPQTLIDQGLINPKTLLPTTVISPILGTTPDPLVKTIHYRFVDPLVLDLDGDGLEITPLATGILFDANGDAIKTATAWVGAGDGLLALDRDANGSIDSGRELFGDETLLADGTKAAHGFAALAALAELSELDSGSVVNGVTVGAGDGVFDAQDAAYSAVRVWTDANQDGLSQAAELQTRADSGVSAITLASAAANTNYGDAILVRSGSFARTDGSSGQAGSFILAQNNFVREFAPIAVSEAAQALPDIGGSGWLRDLREAATQDPQLIDLVQQAGTAATRVDFKEAVKALLLAWSAGSGYSGASALARADGYGLIRVTKAGFAGNRPPKCRRKRKSLGFDGHLCRIPAWNGHGQLSNLKCGWACGLRSLPPFNAPADLATQRRILRLIPVKIDRVAGERTNENEYVVAMGSTRNGIEPGLDEILDFRPCGGKQHISVSEGMSC